MKSLNRVTLIGNLGKDAEINRTQNGIPVVNFSMATTTSYKDSNDQWQDKTEWHRLVLWGKLGESILLYMKKGSKVYAEGRLTTKKWQDNSGKDMYTTEIIVQNIVLLGSKVDSGCNTTQAVTENQESRKKTSVDDDIPF